MSPKTPFLVTFTSFGVIHLEWLASYVLASMVAKVAASFKSCIHNEFWWLYRNWSVSWQTSSIIVSRRSISLFKNVAITAGYNIVLFFDLFIWIIPMSGKEMRDHDTLRRQWPLSHRYLSAGDRMDADFMGVHLTLWIEGLSTFIASEGLFFCLWHWLFWLESFCNIISTGTSQ